VRSAALLLAGIAIGLVLARLVARDAAPPRAARSLRATPWREEPEPAAAPPVGRPPEPAPPIAPAPPISGETPDRGEGRGRIEIDFGDAFPEVSAWIRYRGAQGEERSERFEYWDGSTRTAWLVVKPGIHRVFWKMPRSGELRTARVRVEAGSLTRVEAWAGEASACPPGLGRIELRLLGPDGLPRPGVAVTLSLPTPLGDEQASERTSGDGRLLLDAAPGDAELRVGGFRRAFPIRAGETATLELACDGFGELLLDRPDETSGFALLAPGGARIEPNWRGSGRDGFLGTEPGTYQLLGLPTRTRGDERLLGTVDLRADRTVRLAPRFATGSLRVEATSEEERPPPLSLELSAPDLFLAPIRQLAPWNRPEGAPRVAHAAFFAIPRGSYRLVAHLPGGERRVREVEVGEVETTVTIDLALR